MVAHGISEYAIVLKLMTDVSNTRANRRGKIENFLIPFERSCWLMTDHHFSQFSFPFETGEYGACGVRETKDQPEAINNLRVTRDFAAQ